MSKKHKKDKKEKKTVCPACGGKVKQEWAFCPFCRHDFNHGTVDVEAELPATDVENCAVVDVANVEDDDGGAYIMKQLTLPVIKPISPIALPEDEGVSIVEEPDDEVVDSNYVTAEPDIADEVSGQMELPLPGFPSYADDNPRKTLFRAKAEPVSPVKLEEIIADPDLRGAASPLENIASAEVVDAPVPVPAEPIDDATPEPDEEPILDSDVFDEAAPPEPAAEARVDVPVAPGPPDPEPLPAVAPVEEDDHVSGFLIAGISFACVFCLVVGGLVGALIQKNFGDDQIQKLEEKVEGLEERLKEADPGYGIYNLEQLNEYLNEHFGAVGNGPGDGGDVEYGNPDRGMMGVMIENGKDGVTIIDVDENGAAAESGIEPGDVIEAVNGKAVKTNTQVVDLTSTMKPGDVVLLTIKDKGDVEVRLK